MQILGAGKKPGSLTLLVSIAALATACGGTTVFSGKGPIMVGGEAPAPPPPPPPPPAKPPEPPPKVVVKDNKIEITEKIQFEYNKATILPQSFSLMDEIASTIKKNPHIKKIAIEGHASSEGDKKHNLELSDQRAKAVMTYLVEKGGIPATTFVAKGFGSTKPLTDDSDKAIKGKSKEEAEALHEKNRRVEFNIVEQDVTKKKVAVDTTTGKETVIEEKTSSEKKEVADVPADDDKSKDKKDDKKDKVEKKASPKKVEKKEPK